MLIQLQTQCPEIYYEEYKKEDTQEIILKLTVLRTAYVLEGQPYISLIYNCVQA